MNSKETLSLRMKNVIGDKAFDTSKKLLDVNEILQSGNLVYTTAFLGRTLSDDEKAKRVVLNLDHPVSQQVIDLSENRNLEDIRKGQVRLKDVKKAIESNIQEVKRAVEAGNQNISSVRHAIQLGFDDTQDVLEDLKAAKELEIQKKEAKLAAKEKAKLLSQFSSKMRQRRGTKSAISKSSSRASTPIKKEKIKARLTKSERTKIESEMKTPQVERGRVERKSVDIKTIKFPNPSTYSSLEKKPTIAILPPRVERERVERERVERDEQMPPLELTELGKAIANKRARIEVAHDSLEKFKRLHPVDVPVVIKVEILKEGKEGSDYDYNAAYDRIHSVVGSLDRAIMERNLQRLFSKYVNERPLPPSKPKYSGYGCYHGTGIRKKKGKNFEKMNVILGEILLGNTNKKLKSMLKNEVGVLVKHKAITKEKLSTLLSKIAGSFKK